MMGSFYGLSPYDPGALLFVVAFLGVAAMTAMYGPASRAIRVDPQSRYATTSTAPKGRTTSRGNIALLIFCAPANRLRDIRRLVYSLG